MSNVTPPGFQPYTGHKVFVRLGGLLVIGGIGALIFVYGLEAVLSGSIDVRGKSGSVVFRAYRDGDHYLAYWFYTMLCLIGGSIPLASGLWIAFKRHIPEPALLSK